MKAQTMGRVYIPAAELATRKPAAFSICSQAKVSCIKVLKKTNQTICKSNTYLVFPTHFQTLKYLFFFFSPENIKHAFHFSTLVVEFVRALVNAHIIDMHCE